MNCRPCGSSHTKLLGTVEFHSGYPWPIFNCLDCGCRFTKYDPTVYDTLHANPGSTYGPHRTTAQQCEEFFRQRSPDRLRQVLCGASKHRFVIDEVERSTRATRLKMLEIGCSRGYLTSFFI